MVVKILYLYLCMIINKQKLNAMTTEKFIVQVYEHLSIEITINEKKDGYKFKTPKGFGGRHYYSFCNHLDDAFAEQYPEQEYIIRNNIRNN